MRGPFSYQCFQVLSQLNKVPKNTYNVLTGDNSCHLQSLSQRPTFAMCEPLKGMSSYQLQSSRVSSHGVCHVVLVAMCDHFGICWSHMCESLVLKRRGFANDITPFEGTVSTNFSWHLTDRGHLADIPRYNYDARREKGASVDGAQQRKDWNDIHIFFALKIQSYSLQFSCHVYYCNTNTVLPPCAFDMVSEIPLSIWGIVSRRLSCNKKTWHVFMGFVCRVVLWPVELRSCIAAVAQSD